MRGTIVSNNGVILEYAKKRRRKRLKIPWRWLVILGSVTTLSIIPMGFYCGPKVLEFDLNSGNYRSTYYWYDIPIDSDIYPSHASTLCDTSVEPVYPPKWKLVGMSRPMVHICTAGGRIPIDLHDLEVIMNLISADDEFCIEIKGLYFQLIRTIDEAQAGRDFLFDGMSSIYTSDTHDDNIARVREVCNQYRKMYELE